MATYQGSTVVKRRPKDGEPGIQGPLMVQKEWIEGDTHRYTDEVREYFYVRGADAAQSYWYTLASKGTVTAGAKPTGGAVPAGYVSVTWMKELAVQFFIAEEANLANLIFKDQKLISLRGTVNGVAADYSGQANFEPNIIIDGKNGKITAMDGEFHGKVYATDGEFSGTIDAVSGELGTLTMKSGGYIDLPPTFSSNVGRINNEGISLVFAGDNSQKIEWRSGPFGEFAGRIACNNLGRLQLTSTYGVGIGVEFLDDAITITRDGIINNVNFNDSIVTNMRFALIKFGLSVINFSSSGYKELNMTSSFVVITSAVSGVKISKIITNGGAPTDCEIKVILNASNNVVYLDSTHTDSNIKTHASKGDNFDLYPNSVAFLIFYDEYWYVQTDAGQ